MLVQSRAPSAALQGLPSLSPAVPYRYVLFHFAFITVTRRSVNLAIAASCLTFTAFQVRTRTRAPLDSTGLESAGSPFTTPKQGRLTARRARRSCCAHLDRFPTRRPRWSPWHEVAARKHC